MASPFSKFQRWDALPGLGDDRCQNVIEGGDSGDRITAESLNVKQTSVGFEADLPQGGQISQSFPNIEIACVVDRGFRPYGLSFLVILLDRGVLVISVQARGDAVGDNPGAEHSWCSVWAFADQPASEDQADLIGATNIEVVADDLLEEQPTGHGLVQCLTVMPISA